jgi:hypothetical protein
MEILIVFARGRLRAEGVIHVQVPNVADGPERQCNGHHAAASPHPALHNGAGNAEHLDSLTAEAPLKVRVPGFGHQDPATAR